MWMVQVLVRFSLRQSCRGVTYSELGHYTVRCLGAGLSSSTMTTTRGPPSSWRPRRTGRFPGVMWIVWWRSRRGEAGKLNCSSFQTLDMSPTWKFTLTCTNKKCLHFFNPSTRELCIRGGILQSDWWVQRKLGFSSFCFAAMSCARHDRQLLFGHWCTAGGWNVLVCCCTFSP